MSFAGKVWKLLVGIKDGMVLIFMLMFFALLYAVLTTRPSPGQVREGALLLALDGSVVEEPSLIDPLSLLLSGTLPDGEYSVRDVTRALDAAATDDRIKAVVLDLSRFTGGGQVQSGWQLPVGHVPAAPSHTSPDSTTPLPHTEVEN